MRNGEVVDLVFEEGVRPIVLPETAGVVIHRFIEAFVHIDSIIDTVGLVDAPINLLKLSVKIFLHHGVVFQL